MDFLKGTFLMRRKKFINLLQSIGKSLDKRKIEFLYKFIYAFLCREVGVNRVNTLRKICILIEKQK